MTSSQQEITNKEKTHDSSNSNDNHDKKMIKSRPSTIQQKEDDRAKAREDSIRQTYHVIDNKYDNNSIQDEEKIAIDYMAKDYASFRHALLDLIPRKIPQWKDRSEADMGVMLIELFSYVADELSYFQDRVANEGFLRTSKARSSVANHLRLIDYHIQNGVSANAFIKVEVKDGPPVSAVIPAGFQISTSQEKGEEDSEVVIFETLQEQRIDSAYNEISVKSISIINNNSTGIRTLSAILEGRHAGLRKGHHVLFFQEVALQEDDHYKKVLITRQAIVKLSEHSKIITNEGGNNSTLITWERADEYPESPYGWKGRVSCCANILRASHGRTIQSEVLKEKDQKVSKFAFTLKEGPLAFVSDAPVSSMESNSTLKVRVDGELWEETDSLLKCGPLDHKFSISIDEAGYATIFFGNGRYGLKPREDSFIEAEYRVGSGSVGNVGKSTITQFDLPQNPRWIIEEVIESVTNPLPASGGIDLESLDDARIAGPKSLKVPERAVTLKDYEELVKREFQNEVTNAKARFVYTGSWDTVFVSIDVKGGQKNIADSDYDNHSLTGRIKQYLDRVKMIGYEVQVEEAKYVPIKIELTVCLQKHCDSNIVRGRILSSLSNKDNPLDGKGLFHPDNFTFGDHVYASKIYEVLKNIPEVEYGVITTFRKRGDEETVDSRNKIRSSFSSSCVSYIERSTAHRDEETKKNLELGYIPINENEIITIDNDSAYPQNGMLVVNFVTEDENENGDNIPY